MQNLSQSFKAVIKSNIRWIRVTRQSGCIKSNGYFKYGQDIDIFLHNLKYFQRIFSALFPWLLTPDHIWHIYLLSRYVKIDQIEAVFITLPYGMTADVWDE
jgi:hypothetical protein